MDTGQEREDGGGEDGEEMEEVNEKKEDQDQVLLQVGGEGAKMEDLAIALACAAPLPSLHWLLEALLWWLSGS